MLAALVIFNVLVVAGRIMGELEWSHVGLLFLLIACGLAAVVLLKFHPHALTVELGLIDVGLVLKIFKGDIQIR